MSQFCTQCGTENVNDAKFCKSCGHSLAEQKAPSSSESSVDQPEPMHEQDISVNAESKKENEKYSKFGGWLIVLAVFIVIGVLQGFLRVEHFFENENLDALKLLYQQGMDQKASLLNTIAYISFVSYGLLLTFAISFFRKDILTKNFAIIHFGFNIVAFPIMTYLLVKIDLPTINITTGVIGGAMQTLVALVIISYFMVSERVKKTFVNGIDDENHIMTTLSIGLGAIVLASVLYTNQSAKDIMIAGGTGVSEQTIAESEYVQEAAPAADAAAPSAEESTPVLSEAEQMEKDCNNGQMNKCVYLGTMYSNGNGVQKDDTKALSFYKKACDNGYADVCDNLAAVYYDINMPMAKTVALKAISLHKKNCDHGVAGACTDLYNYYSMGTYVNKDQSIADVYLLKELALYKKACNKGDAYACTNIGRSYLEGSGVEQDISKGENLLKKSCNTGEFNGCRALGIAYEYGSTLEQDYSKASQYYKKACDISNSLGACDDYEKLQSQGY